MLSSHHLPNIEKSDLSGGSPSDLMSFRQVVSQIDFAPGPQEELLRTLFDQTRTLGQQLRQDQPWQADDLANWLRKADLPCFKGHWHTLPDGTRTLQRPPCGLGPHACDAWREALDGLVMGVGDDLRYARHFHGEFGECLDLLFDVSQNHRRWAPVPEQLAPVIAALQTELTRHQTELQFQGYADGTLFFRLVDHHPQLQGHRYGFLLNSVHSLAARLQPDLQLCETTPRAIWEGD